MEISQKGLFLGYPLFLPTPLYSTVPPSKTMKSRIFTKLTLLYICNHTKIFNLYKDYKKINIKYCK